ncbi:MAG: anti-sigma factor, partial [Roseimicrobium sp.]
MNSQDFNSPDLTAYALGELSPKEAARVRQYLDQSPEARAELERIQTMMTVLNQAPAIPVRALHPRQRETVLAMGQIPAVPVAATSRRVVPFRPPQSRVPYARPAGSVTWTVFKYAAAAALTVGAFVLGQKTATSLNGDLLASNSGSHKDLVDQPVTHVVLGGTASAAVTQEPVVVATNQTPVPAAAAAQILGSSRPSTVPKSIVAVASVAERAEPAPAPAAPVPSGAPSLKGFASTASSTESRFNITPKLLRTPPMPREFAGVVLASPLPPNAKPEAPRKPEPQPALMVDSLKAEIASCPWDSSRRLMRIVALVPVEQNGIQNQEQDYKMVAKFDPFHVQGYRLVGEKHMPPSSGDTQATRFAWYEIVPNRNFNPSSDRPVTIGSISIEQPRGAQSPPDSSPPKMIVDRGMGWQDTREDFAFETAMVGWSLLLQGTENTGSLNYKLVLDLAEQNRGE